MADTDFDLIVIGGGPGGYVAAIRAAQLGMKAAVVEREHLGGICLNWGCIPTKAMLRSSEVLHLAQHAADFGLEISGAVAHLDKIVARSRAIAKQLSGGVAHLLKKNKVAVFNGSGHLDGTAGARRKVKVAAGDKTVADLTAAHVILASGARARTLPGIEADGKTVWTYKDALVPGQKPASMLVIGSGAIGVEFASFYNDISVDVTIVEVVDRILPAEDGEVSAFAQKAFEKQGIKILTAAQVTEVKKTAGGARVTISAGGRESQLDVEVVLLSVGIVGNIEDLGLDGTKVKVERGHIVANPWCETGEPGVYAIGDLTGAPWLAHKASHEGVLCVEKIAGENDVHPIDINLIPGCTYCRPQIASVGMTEAQAKDAGKAVKVGRFPFIGNGKAIALGDAEGFIKTIFDAKSGELLGAHMIGAEVTELIQGFSVAKTLETTESDLMHTVFPHPTLSEMMHESVLDAYDRAIHF